MKTRIKGFIPKGVSIEHFILSVLNRSSFSYADFDCIILLKLILSTVSPNFTFQKSPKVLIISLFWGSKINALFSMIVADSFLGIGCDI